MAMLPNKPYVIRAFYDWIVASDCTPYLVVDSTVEYVEVPMEFVENDQIILNITPRAVQDLRLDNRFVAFSAQFAGELRDIYAPIAAISAIYAKENGRGMMFDNIDEDEDHPMLKPISKAEAFGGGDNNGGGSSSGGASVSHLKIVK